MSVRKLADKLKISFGYINDVENKRVLPIRGKMVKSLCDFLEITRKEYLTKVYKEKINNLEE